MMACEGCHSSLCVIAMTSKSRQGNYMYTQQCIHIKFGVKIKFKKWQVEEQRDVAEWISVSIKKVGLLFKIIVFLQKPGAL